MRPDIESPKRHQWIKRDVTPIDRKNRVRTCIRKKRYHSHNEAAERRNWLKGRFEDSSELRIYECPFCNGFHFANNDKE